MWSTGIGIVGARHRQASTGVDGDEVGREEDKNVWPVKKDGKGLEGRKEDFSIIGSTDLENNKKPKCIALRCMVFLLFVAASITILFVPTSFQHDLEFRTAQHMKSRSIVQNVALLSDFEEQSSKLCSATCPDEKILNWLQNSSIICSLKEERKGHLGMGLLNVPRFDLNKWKSFAGGETPVVFNVQPVNKDLKWSELYPEWIDEEEQWHTPKCPHLLMPEVKKGSRLDIVIARLPCRRVGESWSRDVSRLQILLASARVAVQTGSKSSHVLLCSEYRPLPNLFTCGELIQNEGHFWLYKVDLRNLRQKLSLPIGSCELSVPLTTGVRSSVRRSNSASEAYVTILHSAQLYVCGAIAVAQSIRLSGSTRDMVILVDENIESIHREGLKSAGWKIRQIKRIRNPKAERSVYNEWNYSKFRLWQLTDYKKIIYIDADLLVLRNIDFLFSLPDISAIGNHESLFNSGVMVIEPSNCTFQMLMDQINEIESYNGGDQGYLNEVFTWWHRLPKHVNFLKHFWSNDSEEIMLKTELFAAEPPVLYVIHYLGIKPWLCFRDYDCNWNQQKLHDYASDVAHARWWKVHDSMPKHLQEHCFLRSKEKASLEIDRRQAEAEGYNDQHWKIKIKDPRLKVCREDFCYWESMLLHWGETNQTISTEPAGQ
ncbi:hypothetical protein O6H91_06G010800 [Diphasiastrum complanatum]|uniref:Uncharacterized protein n=3 Tax=Diphasiastrum complanatum TaxID=34168 RepID=A0ACC2DAS6_DIPCM|nr:hypothetical protein O6H91_06G010800 [Diphasiastrum complanatum]